MAVAGIVAEYNPFHSGHAWQIKRTRDMLGPEGGIVAVMSGNWVQQADCAIADKWLRARLALEGGADLVLELPTVWATASAEAFARGAVSILAGSGVVDVLSFGSECGDIHRLVQVADCLDSEMYQQELSRSLERGLSFAAARQAAAEAILGEQGKLLAQPNNNLGIEYIRALRGGSSTIRPFTVLRQGVAHNSLSGPKSGELQQPFVSATWLRRALREGRWTDAEIYLGVEGRYLLEEQGDFPSLERLERAMLARVRSMAENDWAALPDAGVQEGLPRRLVRAAHGARSMEEFYALAKTKRYTHARLRRLALWAFLGVKTADLPLEPPYIRVLGFTPQGQELLRSMKERSALPILTKPTHSRRLEGVGEKLLELEARCTDLFDLCWEHIPSPGREWTTGPVRLNRRCVP